MNLKGAARHVRRAQRCKPPPCQGWVTRTHLLDHAVPHVRGNCAHDKPPMPAAPRKLPHAIATARSVLAISPLLATCYVIASQQRGGGGYCSEKLAERQAKNQPKG